LTTLQLNGVRGEEPLSILLFMRNASGYFRIFSPALEELLTRGHRIHVALDRADALGGDEWLEALTRTQPGFSFDINRSLRKSDWYQLARDLRLSRDYVEFLRPTFRAAPELVRRAENRAPVPVRRLFAHRLAKRPGIVSVASRILCGLESAIPPFESIRRYVTDRHPDVVLVAPHLMPGSLHSLYVQAGQALGLPTAICVASWDNLSSKQLLRAHADAVFVWNDLQRNEAVRLHGVAADTVVVTGAQCFDHWFDWVPRSRDDFCRRVGLSPAQAYVLYIGGSLFPAEATEAEFAATWVESLRAHEDPVLRELNVLIRPHPKRRDQWESVAFDRFPGVAVWPRGGRIPVTDDDRADFFDSIYHSAAVFGINTSAMIEAAIVGRPVMTVLEPTFAGSQTGVFHFRYLSEVGGGFLIVAADLPEHFEQLSAALRDPNAARSRGFVEAFVRPCGLDRPAAAVFADEVERLARRPRLRNRRSVSSYPLSLLAPIAAGYARLVAHRRRRDQAPSHRVRRAVSRLRARG
jgi:hypothetical protein